MKHLFIIVFVSGCLLAVGNLMMADNKSRIVDDSYYWPEVDSVVLSEPVYDRNARELIFIEDTTQYPDTVRMRIVEK